MNNHVLFMTLVICLNIANGFDLDLDHARIYNEGSYKVLEFPCQGGSGDYQWEFKDLPQNWYARGGKIYALDDEFEQNKYHGIKVGVFDKVLKKIIKRSIIFSYNQERFSDCFSIDYNTDFGTPQKLSQLIKQRVLDELNYNHKSRQVKHQNHQKKSIRKQYVGYFPTRQQIEQRIKSGDLDWIRTTISDVLNNQQECHQTADFLDRLLSILKGHTSIIENLSQNLKQELLLVQEEINFLKQQLKDIKHNDKHNSDSIHIKLENFRSHLHDLKHQRSEIDKQIRFHQKDCDNYEGQLYKKKKGQYKNHHESYIQYKQKVSNIDKEIDQLYQRIEFLKKQKHQYQIKCDQYKIKCDQFQNQFEKINGLIINARSVINQLQNRIPSIQTEIKSFQFKCTELQSQISLSKSVCPYLAQKNKLAEQQKIYEQKKSQIQSLQIQLTTIIQAQIQFQQIINNQYYYCYKKPKESDLATVPQTYKSDEFLNYLQNAFGVQASSEIRARFSGKKLNLKKFSIFSPNWIKIYGLPYTAGYGNNMDVHETEFSCQKGQDYETFTGIVKQITKNVINVEDKYGNEYTVHLGGCTKLQTATQYDVASVGDSIYWKGSKRLNKEQKNHYNGYHITCY